MNPKKLCNIKLSTQMLDYVDISTSFQAKGNYLSVNEKSGFNVGEENKTEGKNSIAAGENTVTYTNNSYAFGEGSIAGTRSFRIISGDLYEKTYELCSISNLSIGLQYSLRLGANYDAVGFIENIDETTKKITVSEMPINLRTDENLSDEFLSAMPWYNPAGNGIRYHNKNLAPEETFTDYLSSDTNTIWIIGHPELGELSACATGAFSNGYCSIAQMQYSHAEGNETIAAGKYSHAEGQKTRTGWCAHAEGNATSAFGLNSHSEGYMTLAFGDGSHVEGRNSISKREDKYSFVWNGTDSNYYSNGRGSFNINPLNGIVGFNIGNRNFYNRIKESTFDLENDILEIQNNLADHELDYISSVYQISKPCEFIKYTNGSEVFDKTLTEHGTVIINVSEGQQYKITTSYSNYAGVAIVDLSGSVISSWNNDYNYILSADDGIVTSVPKYYAVHKTEYSSETELRNVLNTKTKTQYPHWHRLEYENSTYLPTMNDYEITIPTGGAQLKISDNMMYAKDSYGTLRTPPIIKKKTYVYKNILNKINSPLSGFTADFTTMNESQIISALVDKLGGQVKWN